MDPATHLVLPMLILLAARQDPRLVIPLSFFAIFPDFDSVIGIHRGTFHNIFVVAIIPLIFIAWARVKRPNLVLPGLIVLFYLVSHAVLDLSGIALMYPIYEQAIYFRPAILFQTEPHLNFDFHLEYGVEELTQTADYTFISELGFTYIFLFVLLAVVFRKEVIGGVRQLAEYTKQLLCELKKRIRH